MKRLSATEEAAALVFWHSATVKEIEKALHTSLLIGFEVAREQAATAVDELGADSCPHKIDESCCIDALHRASKKIRAMSKREPHGSEWAAIEARAAAATRAPLHGERFDSTVKYQVRGADGALVDFGFIGVRRGCDEKFALFARGDIPALLNEFFAAQKTIDELREKLQKALDRVRVLEANR